jgi:hypothetical protein
MVCSLEIGLRSGMGVKRLEIWRPGPFSATGVDCKLAKSL